METIISLLIVMLPPLIMLLSTIADKQGIKSDSVSTEQLNKVYLPIHKMLNDVELTDKSQYADISAKISKIFDDEYLLVDCVSKKKFQGLIEAIKTDNLFKMGVAYKEFYNSIDYYFNTLKKQLGYPYKCDFKSIKYNYANNSSYRNSVSLSLLVGILVFTLVICYCFGIVDNELVIKEHTINETLQYVLILGIFNIIYFFWNRSKR
ncbi:MAG: hypothetical protein ACI4I2_12595 [Oscillospiraceae bacterium]